MSFDNRSVVAGHKIAFRLHKLQNLRFDTTFDLEITESLTCALINISAVIQP